MSKEDYQAISKLIEAVIGKDTIAGVRLIEGIRFYFNSKIEEIKQTNTQEIKITKPILSNESSINHTIGAEEAMRRYTESIIKDNSKYKKKSLIK